MVDLVQVFTGDAAVRAAIEDGMDRSAAEVRDTYVRNQNPRLRTLEMAGGVRLNLIGSCESTGQEALFTKLIKDATYGQGHLFYYTLHVQGGVVRADRRAPGPARLLTHPSDGAARPDRAAPSHAKRQQMIARVSAPASLAHDRPIPPPLVGSATLSASHRLPTSESIRRSIRMRLDHPHDLTGSGLEPSGPTRQST